MEWLLVPPGTGCAYQAGPGRARQELLVALAGALADDASHGRFGLRCRSIDADGLAFPEQPAIGPGRQDSGEDLLMGLRFDAVAGERMRESAQQLDNSGLPFRVGAAWAHCIVWSTCEVLGKESEYVHWNWKKASASFHCISTRAFVHLGDDKHRVCRS